MTTRVIQRRLSPSGPQPGRCAFTLIEVLVSVAIMALLIAILVPGLAQARRATDATRCLSNLKQMATAAQSYTAVHGRYMPYKFNDPAGTAYAWDLTLVPSGNPAKPIARAGLLWSGRTLAQINQCPSYEGKDNYIDYPYSGYNYNTSFVGWCLYQPERDKRYRPTGRLIAVDNPARPDQIRRPTDCAVFGDGEYSGGANKFMRSPLPGRDKGVFSGRSAGTQGYRHLKKTNVAFADGHAASHAKRYTQMETSETGEVAPGTGFLSQDNRLYDLE